MYPYTRSCAAGPVNLEAVPASGYTFANWSGDLSGSENPTTIMMDSDKEVTANFIQIQVTYTLTVDASPGGGIEVNGTTPSSYPAVYTFAEGASVNLKAVPAFGYTFANWSGDLSGSQNPTTIMMDSDKEVTANFSQVTYTLTLDAGLGGGIEVNGIAPSSYPAVYTFAEGASVNLEAIPASGYSFANWSGGLSGSENPITLTIDSNKEITANFSQVTYTLAVDAGPGGSIEVNGVTPSSYPAVYTFAEGTSVNLEAVPASGYSFADWSGDLSGSENPTTIMMDSGKEVTANFTQITYTLTVVVSPTGGMVTTEPSQPAQGYVTGTEVTLTAIASEGYEFDHWSGALSGSEDTITITMDSDKEITASFIEVATSTFPWWWIVVGVAVVGLLVYFLVIRGLRA